jgi:hypothetical protein
MWLLHGMDQASGMLLEMRGVALEEPLTYLDSLPNTSTALNSGSLRQMTLDSMLARVQPSDLGEDIPVEFHFEDDPERLLAGQVLAPASTVSCVSACTHNGNDSPCVRGRSTLKRCS